MMKIIGNSTVFLEAVKLLSKMANHDVPVLIEGETGTGKELAAHVIHDQGKRRDGPFIPINCGAIPDSLIENELFGHQKGAYTGAGQNQPGLIPLAHRGTLFLDEMDALSSKGQVTLLRFLQDQRYRPLGGRVAQHADVRIIAAANVDLMKLAEAGLFRMDLLFRLKVLYVKLPPLRERKGDPTLLAEHFVRICSARYGQPIKTFHPNTLIWFDKHSWPGNIRELENLVYREYLLVDGLEISIRLPYPLTECCNPVDLSDTEWLDLNFKRAKANAVAEFERRFLSHLIAHAQGNITVAANMAGKERRALGKLLKKYHIDKTKGGTGKWPTLRPVSAPS